MHCQSNKVSKEVALLMSLLSPDSMGCRVLHRGLTCTGCGTRICRVGVS